jgi:hypothetical protein
VGALPFPPATQLPRVVSLFAFLYSCESKANGTQVARLVREERLSRLKLRATAMAAGGATPPSHSELLHPALPRPTALLAFGSAVGKRSNPIRGVRAGMGAGGHCRRRRTRAGRGSSCRPTQRSYNKLSPRAEKDC